MGAQDASIAESLANKLTLGYNDNLRVAGLAFLETELPVVTTVEHGCCPYKTSMCDTLLELYHPARKLIDNTQNLPQFYWGQFYIALLGWKIQAHEWRSICDIEYEVKWIPLKMKSVVLAALKYVEGEGLKLGYQLVGITAGPGERQWFLNWSGG